MQLMNFRTPKIFLVIIFLVIIFLSFLVTGCSPLIIIEEGKNSAVQEFYVDDYKMQVRITRVSDDNEYLCSFSLFNKNDTIPLNGIKSNLDIIKYGPFHRRYKRKKYSYLTGLEPIYNRAMKEYEQKYKFTTKDKYELTIRLKEIAGKALKEDILISFDQEAK